MYTGAASCAPCTSSVPGGGEGHDHLIRKIANFSSLSVQEVSRLREVGGKTETFGRGEDIVKGERPRKVFVMTEGFAIRYRLLEDGRRQILTFLIPGDLCDLHVFLLQSMDHSIAALTPTKVVAVETRDIVSMVFQHPRITAALWWAMLQEEAILRERIVALGRRAAEERIAYLLCELFWRLEAVGEIKGGSYVLPLTQEQLGDALGLTPSYVNRVLGKLRVQDVIDFGKDRLEIRDVKRLTQVAGFDGSYLHFTPPPEEMRRYFESMEEGAPEDAA